jgi:hypothetical protein
MSVGTAALSSNISDLQQLEPRDRLAVGLQAIKLAHEIGENVEQHGDGDRWKQRIRRACRLMARLTELRLSPADPTLPFQEAELVETGQQQGSAAAGQRQGSSD